MYKVQLTNIEFEENFSFAFRMSTIIISDNELQLCCVQIKSQVWDDFHVNKKRHSLTVLSLTMSYHVTN